MKINYTARNTTITPEIKKHCERRLNSIKKFLGYDTEVDVLLAQEKYRNKVEINVKTKGATLNAIEETEDMYGSLGIAFDSIEKRVKKEKEKLRERKRRRMKEPGSFPTTPETEGIPAKIVRTREFSLKPLSVEEAIMLMESRKHEVFMFRVFESEKWAVLYKRKDGNFGFVEPD